MGVNFIDPTRPKNATRVIEYVSKTIDHDVTALRQLPRPTKGGVENRNYYVSVIADNCDLDFILRCPPEKIPEWRQSHDLYNLEREFHILLELSSLSIGLPTPRAYGYDAGEAFGVPCFLMERLDGESMNYHFQPCYNESLIVEFAEAVATVCMIEYQSNFWLRKNLPVWTQAHNLDYMEAKSYPFRDDPLRSYLMDWLRERMPPPQPLVTTHGDPNPSNFLMKDNHISGVVDWEFACVTDDPLNYVMCVGWLHDREELTEIFCHIMGRTVEELEWFRVIGLFGGTYVNYNEEQSKNRRRLAELVGFHHGSNIR